VAQSPLEELEILVRAKYSILYVLSWEEQRVLEAVRVAGHELGREVHVWSLTKGMQPPLTGRAAEQRSGLPAEVEALAGIHHGPDKAIYVLTDFHPYMSDHRVIRLLRDLSRRLRGKAQTVIILSPTLKLPPELEKEVTLVEFGLPDPAEIGHIVDDRLKDAATQSADISLSQEDRERLIAACQGLTLGEIEDVLARSLVEKKRADVDAVLTQKKQIIRKSGILEYYPFTVEMKDIGGLDALKDWLQKRSDVFSDKAKEFGLPSPKGVLILGVQGCGKSLIAKSVSSLWGLPLLRMDVGKIFSGIVGSSEENMRKAIRVAESVAPCVLWTDELEKGFAGVQSSSFSDSGTTARVFATFLAWMQDKTAPVFLVATANDVTQLPPELLRKGRFDEVFFVDLPNERDRLEIFRIHIAKRGRKPSKFNLKGLAAATDGYSGAEIEQTVIAALFTAFSKGRDIRTSDLLAEAKHIVPLSRMMREEISELRDWAKLRARPATLPVEPEEVPAAKTRSRAKR
jgi:ATP-dependent 26S proteasome regulatory subunit